MISLRYLINIDCKLQVLAKNIWKFSQLFYKKLRYVYNRSYICIKVNFSHYRPYIMFDKIEVSDKSKTSDKLEKFLTDRDIILNCLIPDMGVNDIFKVTIFSANNNQISSFVDEIRNCYLNQFQDIDLTRLTLYKVGFVTDNIIINTLKNNNVFIIDRSVEIGPRTSHI